MTDNGPQFSSQCFAQFAKDYHFTHETSSPHYLQSNEVKMKKDYDCHHVARDLPELQPGDAVWIAEFKETGRVLDEVQPRSYVVQTPTTVIQRQQMNLTERPPIPSESPEPKGKDATEVYPTQDKYTLETPRPRKSADTSQSSSPTFWV